MSLTARPNQTSYVTPGLTRGEAFLRGLSSGRGVSKGSLAPDQVRGDDVVLGEEK